MNLKQIGSTSTYHRGFGAGSGSVDVTEYECPCGKGRIITEKDNIPGFRDTWTRIECPECQEKYSINPESSQIDLIEK